MKVGTRVKIDKCDECPKIVGKVVTIRGFGDTPGVVLLNFGKGRPQLNRPKSISMGDLSIVLEEGDGDV